jgi:tRNA (mo5U34)-methyltransferase
MNRDALRREVARIKWWHTIDLGNGVVTPGMSNPAARLRQFGIPGDLQGKTALDIGAWDGFFSFEAERRGAKRVLATDSFCWGGDGWGTKAGFELARKALKSNVEDLEIDVLDLSPETVGVFDLVLFLGVLYHMRHPLLALERVHSVTANHLILETELDMLGCKRPAMAFYPGAELANDPTNWWGPNPAAVEAMLRTVGFREVRRVPRWFSPPFRVATALVGAGRKERPFIKAMRHPRMVFHAWR